MERLLQCESVKKNKEACMLIIIIIVLVVIIFIIGNKWLKEGDRRERLESENREMGGLLKRVVLQFKTGTPYQEQLIYAIKLKIESEEP